MRARILLIIALILIITGCALEPVASTLSEADPPQTPSPASSGASIPEPQPDPPSILPFLTPQEVVAEYFARQYMFYLTFEEPELNELLDMDVRSNQNTVVWAQALNRRRRLILEHDFCYVETREFPYQIKFLEEDELSDVRMDVWSGFWKEDEEAVLLHFVIEGEKGKAYPPLMAVNSEHTMRLRKTDGSWKISFHYFPGSRRKFNHSLRLALPEEERSLASLVAEFAEPEEPLPGLDFPVGAARYRGDLAAGYALEYTEALNPSFYNIGDWMGNCANFTSQSISFGLGGGDFAMNGNWFAGSGGGSPAWENVNQFWLWAVERNGLPGISLSSPTQLRAGDLIQTSQMMTRTGDIPDQDDRFGHSLVVADEATLMLGQNSPGCFVYYSDLLFREARFFRPGYLLG